MRKKVTQRLVSGVLCLAMGITLISPVTSRAAETSEPTTQATTESASTETTTEVPVTTEVQVAPSEDVLFDHFYDTGILPATLQSKDFSSCELLVAADPIIFTKNTTVLSAYNGVYLLRFSSPEEAMYAYSYYYDKVELIDINAVIFQTSDDEHYEEVQADLSDLNQGDDALSEASTLPDVDLKKNTIALVDTGCEGTNVTQSVSVLGGESKDDNGHGTRMYDVIVEENPDAEILSIKALDKDGKAQVSDIYAAITYAVDNKADIINLSISAMATRDSAIVEDAIKDAVNKGITVVGAAGNAGRDARFYVPGKIDEAVIVGACYENGEKIKISNFGQSVDFNVTASSTSEAAARFSGIVSKDGMDGLKINEEKIFATDYVVATSTDAEKTTEASETLTTETVTTEATESATTEREESATSESLTTEENAVDTTVETTEVSTRTDADGSKWDIKGLIDNLFEVQDASYNNGGFNLNITSSDNTSIMANGKHYMTCIAPGGNQASGSNPPYGEMEGLYWMCGNANTNYNSPFHFERSSIEAIGWRFAVAVPGARHMYYVYYKGANPNTKTVPSYKFHNALGTLLENNTVVYDNHTFSPATDAGAPTSNSYKVKDLETGNYVTAGTNLKTKSDNGVLRTDRLQFSTGTGYFGATVNVPTGFTFHYYINGGEYDAAGGTHVDVPDGTEGYFYTNTYTGKALVATNSAGWYVDSVYILVPLAKASSPSYGDLSIQQMVAPVGKMASLNFEIESASVTVRVCKTAYYGAETRSDVVSANPKYASVKGAVYGLYKTKSDAENKVNAVGYCIQDDDEDNVSSNLRKTQDLNSEEVMLQQGGTYYLREVKKPDSNLIRLSDNIYSFNLDLTKGRHTIGVPMDKNGNVLNLEQTQPGAYITNPTVVEGSNHGADGLIDEAIWNPVTLKKSITNTTCVTGSPLYSLIGTTYELYKDAACTTKAYGYTGYSSTTGEYSGKTAAKFVVNDNAGNSNTLYMLPGVYYAKETVAGKGYKKNPNPIRVPLVNVNVNTTYTINATDEPILDPVRIELNKIDSEGITIDPADVGNATLEGAVFKVAYYNDYYDKDTYKSKNPERVWYIQTKYDTKEKMYKSGLDSDHLASGYRSSEFYYNTVGQPNFPLGTVVITEEKASNGYKIDESSMTVAGQKCDNEVFIGQVIEKDGYAEMYIDDGSGSYIKNAENETIKVNNKAADGSDLAIAEQVKRTDISFVKVNYETGVEMADIFFKITSSTGEAHYVKTGTKGDYSSTKVTNTQYTNYYDRLFDDDKENDYIDVDGTKTYIGDLDCGLWFFGTDDQSEWKTENIKDDKGSLRYDEKYVLTEEIGKNNKGYQMIVPEEFSATVENGTQFLGVISNVPTPSIKTQEWDKDTKSHISIFREGEVNNIMDTVTYKYLTAGEKYTYKGILMELNADGKLKGPLLDADGNYIRANKAFTVDSSYTKSKQEKCGSEDVEFSFTGTDLKGKEFVIFEYLFAGTSDELIPVNEDGTIDETGVLEFKVDNSEDTSIPDKITVKHTDETDIDQIGLFPDIETEAFATETEDNMLLLTDSMKVSDKIHYNGLNTGIDYKVKSWIMYEDIRDGKEYAIKDKDGNDLELVTPYTAEGQNGTIKVNLPEFDGTQLLDEDGKMITKGVTVYEEISLNGVVYASETDINNKKQTVYIPEIGTSASETETGLQVVKAGKINVTDKITFGGLVPGETYDLEGTVVNQRTGEVHKNEDGTEVKSNVSYVAAAESGVTYMDFTFDAPAGETYVIFEDIYHNGVKIATHASLDSKPQTIWVPKITTTLREGETGSKNVLYTDDVFLIDEVSYENLPDGEYIMRGTPMNKDTEKALAEGEKKITTDQPFTVKNGVGKVDVGFHFDATKTDLIKKDGSMSPITCFEEVIVNAHIDEEGHYETVTIPEYDEEVSQTKYFCLDCDDSFNTEEEAKDHCDKKAHENGYEAKDVVIETVHHDAETKEQYVKDHDAMDVNTVVAEEKSIDNVDQTVTPPEIHTTATDGVTGTHVGVVGDKATTDDVVKYKGLIPGKEYEFVGRLYIQPEELIGTAIYKDEQGNIYINGEYAGDTATASDADIIELEPLTDENGVPVTAKTKAVVEEADGEVIVHFEFSSALLAGKTVTCFEDVYYNGKKICTHSDITDSSQSVKYPSCHTTATNAADGTHIAKPDEDVTIIDRVYYENLVAGEEYSARGILQDYDAKSAVSVDDKEVVGEATFIAESESGYADVEITLNATSLANKTTVVFEDIYYKGVIVCSHRDYECTDQTIVFSDQPKTGDFLLWVFAGLGVVGLFGIAAVLFKKKK